MDVLYKYSGLMPLEYFDNPTIKLSVPEHLNDPFEYNTSENITTAIKKNIMNIGASEDEAESLAKIFRNTVHSMISKNGIISLTETPRNTLMWAHYASQHNGMCIGFKRSFLEHIKKGTNDGDITISDPVKVNYDNLRFSSEQEFEDVIVADKIAVTRHLLTKSDEWMYEKEHRCIIPYYKASKIMLYDDKIKMPKIIKAANRETVQSSCDVSLVEWASAFAKANLITKTEKKQIYTINQDGDEEHKSNINCAIQLLSNSPHVSFLIDTSKEMIDSIYFGCKVDKQIVKKYFEKVNKKIKIFHLEVCKERFELKPVRVDENYFI